MGNFKVYNASAGSGKTFTLVKEFLKLTLQQAAKEHYFRKIMAITFTNKAASEMKSRILTGLLEIGNPALPESGVRAVMLPEIIAGSPFSEAEIIENARQTFFAILHHYDDFPISTIDSFVHKIIRRFANDLQLPANFDIELDKDNLIEQTIDLLISEVGKDKEITKVLIDFIAFKDRDSKSVNITKDLTDFAGIMFREDTIENLSAIRDLTFEEINAVFKRIYLYRKQFEEDVARRATKAVQLIASKGIDIRKDFFHSNSGIGTYFLNISQGKMEKIPPNSYVRKAIEEDYWYKKNTASDIQAAIDSIKDDLRNIFKEIQSGYREYLDLGAISHYAHPMRLLVKMYRIMETYKFEQNLLSISDFNPLINRIIRNTDVPFIYEKIASHYQHFMIDEFQDTSLLQWQNLLPLVHNSLSENRLNLVVGDGKQAIYRWRNGEVQQFIKLPEIYRKSYPQQKEYERMLKNTYEPQRLKINRRSRKTIVDLNISLFSYLKKYLSPDFKTIYSQLEDESAANQETGYVEMTFVERSEEPGQEYLDEVLRIIKENIEEKKYQAKDIAILCQRRKDAALTGNYLMEKGIPVLSNESLLLNSSVKVRLLIALAQYLLRRDMPVVHAEILFYARKTGLLDTAYEDLFKDVNTAAEDFVSRYLGDSRQREKQLELPLYEIFETIVRKLFPRQDYDVYISFLLENILSFEGKKSEDLASFLEWWEAEKDKLSILIPEGVNAVKVMTIHKAKGLEFPVVIFPFASARIRIKKDVWIQDYRHDITLPLENFLIPINKKLENTGFENLYIEEKNQTFLDLINVMYVAFTRPEDKLYVIAPQRIPENSIPHFLKDFLNREGKWEDNRYQYSFGENISNTRREPQKAPSSRYGKQFISHDWKDRIELRTGKPLPEKTQTDYGILMHTFLAEISQVGDIPKVLRKYVVKGILQKEEVASWEEKLFAIVSHPLLAMFFTPSNRILVEKEIAFQGKTYRPDRVVVDGNTAFIIDFKTGKKNDLHKEQLNRYAALLEKMNYDEIHKAIIYIGDEIELEEF